MAEEKIVEMKTAANGNAPEEDEELEIDYIVKFKKPFKFEGKEYTELDLSGLENTNALDLEAVNKEVGRVEGSSPFAPELSTSFAIHMAARVTGKPIEFIQLLPAKEMIKVRARVSAYFFT